MIHNTKERSKLDSARQIWFGFSLPDFILLTLLENTFSKLVCTDRTNKFLSSGLGKNTGSVPVLSEEVIHFRKRFAAEESSIC